MFAVIVKQRVLPGKSEIFKKNVAEMAPHTRQYPGCVSYELLQSREDENQFIFCEVWDNQEAFDKHFGEKFTKDFEKTLEGVADGDVEPYICDYVL